MQSVCHECHNTEFINNFYTKADATTEKVNAWVIESDELMAPLMFANAGMFGLVVLIDPTERSSLRRDA